MTSNHIELLCHELSIDMCPERRVNMAIHLAGVPTFVANPGPEHVCTSECDPSYHCGWDECPECPEAYHEEIRPNKAGLFFY